MAGVLRARGVLGRCAAVLSGYLGDRAIGEVILETVDEVRRLGPGALYCRDPVMGDVGRNGMGDVFSAVFLAELLAGAPLPGALTHATATLYGLLRRVEAGARDLPLVAAQEEIVRPSQVFAARPV